MESWKPKLNMLLLLNKRNNRSTSRSSSSNPSFCKKHPKHRQSPGVCSLCLADRLSQLHLQTKPSTSAIDDSSSSCSFSYLSSTSSCSSPVDPTSVFNKSRSMAFRSGKNKSIDVDYNRGIWSKLLHRKNKGLMPSRTTRDRVI